MADLGMYINVQGKGIREVSKELDGLTDSAARTEQAASQLGLATDEYQKRLRGLQGIAKAYKVDQEQIASASMRVTQANFELVNSENQVIAATMRVSDSAEQAGISMNDYLKRLERMKKAAYAAGSTQDELGKSYLTVSNAAYHLTTANGDIIRSMPRTASSMKEAQAEARILNGELDALKTSMSQSAVNAGMGVDEYIQRLKNMQSAAHKAGAMQNELANSYINVTDTSYHLTTANGDIIRSMPRAASSMKDVQKEVKLLNGEFSTLASSMSQSAVKAGMGVEEYVSRLNKLKTAAYNAGSLQSELANSYMKVTSSAYHLTDANEKIIHSFPRAGASMRDAHQEARVLNGEISALSASMSKSAVNAGMGAEEYIKRLNTLKTTAHNSGVMQKELDGAYLQVTNTAYHLVDANGKVVNSLARGKNAMSAAKNEARELNGEVSGLSSRFGTFSSVIAGYASLQTLRTFASWADSMSSIRSQIGFVTDTTSEAIKVQEQLLGISNRTYASMEATATLYTRTARAMADYGKTQQEVLKFTEAVSNAMRVGGVSAQEQASALLQLSQALGSGRLQGDEFRSISEAAPIMLDILAKHLKITRGELKALSSTGAITGQVIFDAMTQAGDGLQSMANKIPLTLGQSFTVLKNNSMEFVDSMVNGSGAMSVFANGVTAVANNLNGLATIIGSVAMGHLARYTVAKYESAKASIASANTKRIEAAESYKAALAERNNAAAVLANMQAKNASYSGSAMYSAARIAEAQATLKATNEELKNAAAKRASSRAGGAVLGLFGGPIGLVATVGMLGFAYASANGQVERNNEALKNQIPIVSQLTTEWDKYNKSKKEEVRQKTEADLADVEKKRRETVNRLSKMARFEIDESDLPSSIAAARVNEVTEAYEKYNSHLLNRVQLEKVLTSNGVGIHENTTKYIDSLTDLRTKADNGNESLEAMGGAVFRFGEVGKDGSKGVQVLSSAVEQYRDDVKAAKAETEKFQAQFNKDFTTKEFKLGFMKQGMSPEAAEYAAKLQQLNGVKLTAEQLSEMEFNQQRMSRLDDDINAMVDGWKKAKDAPNEAAKKLKEDADFVNKSIEDLEKQRNAIGKTPQEIERMNLAVKGATAKQLNYIESLQSVIAANEAYAKVMEKLNGIDYRVDTLGMTAMQKELYDLKQAGATREQLAYAERQLRTIEQFEESQKKLTESAGVMKNAADISLEAATGEKAKAEKAIDQVSYYGPRKSDAEIFGYESSSFGGYKPPTGFNGKMPATGGLPKNIPSRAAQGDTQQNQNKEAYTLKIMTADGKEVVGDYFLTKDGQKLFKNMLTSTLRQERQQVKG